METTNTNQVACYFCKASKDADAAIESGWAPGFWKIGQIGQIHIDRCVCDECALRHLETDRHGETIWRAGK